MLKLLAFVISQERRKHTRSIFSHRNVIMLSFMLGILVTVFTGCRSFIGRFGDPFYGGDDPRYFEDLIDDSCEQFDDKFDYELADDEDLRVIDSSSDFKNDCLEAQPLLRFVWFSDVQLRQQEVKLFNKETSRDFDDIIPSFEHNQVQEDFDWAVYLSLIVAINRL